MRNKQNSTAEGRLGIACAIDPNDAPRAVKEYLDVLERSGKFGAASEVEPNVHVPF